MPSLEGNICARDYCMPFGKKIVSFANNKIQSSPGYHENSAPFISVAKNKKLHRHSAGDMWVNNPSSFQTDSS